MKIVDHMAIHCGVARDHCLDLGLTYTSRISELLDVYLAPLPARGYQRGSATVSKPLGYSEE